MAKNGAAYSAVVAGAVLIYAGLKDYSILTMIKDVVQGKPPSTGQTPIPLSTPGSAPIGVTTGITGVQASALPSSGTFSTSQLQALWVQAGGSQATAKNAACHAMQESSGNPLATSSNPDGGENVGLWQLDTKGKGAGYSVSTLQNALNNARITVNATGNGRDWSAWSTPGC
jgi:hypothetical protein